MVDLKRVEDLLRRYEGRYEFLNAFADDVDELREVTPAGLTVTDAGDGEVLLQLNETRLLVKLFADQGIARFRSAQPAAMSSGRGEVGMAWDNLVRTALSSAAKKKEDLLGGVVVGILVGAQKPIERMLALKLEPATGDWQRFDGPLLRWAKQTLRPALSPAA